MGEKIYHATITQRRAEIAILSVDFRAKNIIRVKNPLLECLGVSVG